MLLRSASFALGVVLGGEEGHFRMKHTRCCAVFSSLKVMTFCLISLGRRSLLYVSGVWSLTSQRNPPWALSHRSRGDAERRSCAELEFHHLGHIHGSSCMWPFTQPVQGISENFKEKHSALG